MPEQVSITVALRDPLDQRARRDLHQIARVGGEAERDAGEHMDQQRDQRWIVGEMRVQMIDRPAGAPLALQQRGQMHRIIKALEA